MKTKKLLLITLIVSITHIVHAAPMSGTYYVGSSETSPNYTSLATAFSAINTNGVGGDIVLSISSSLTEANDIALGVNTGNYTITIKPKAGVTPTITFSRTTGYSGGLGGHIIIGAAANNSGTLTPTNNIVIDGSNTNGGTTKDLTLLGATTSGTVTKPVINVIGNCDYITVKNCAISRASSSSGNNACVSFRTSGTDVPNNVKVQNCTLTTTGISTQSIGVKFDNYAATTVGMTDVEVSNCTINHSGTSAIYCTYVDGNANFFNNEISANITGTSAAGQGVYLGTRSAQDVAGTYNVYNNTFNNIVFSNNTAGDNNGYISIDNNLTKGTNTNKTVNIFNNFITGWSITNSVSNSKIYGIRISSTSNSNIYHNTIVIPDMTNMSTFGTSYIAGISVGSPTESAVTATSDIRNNIIISNEQEMKSWCIRKVGTAMAGSNYNDLYCASATNGYVGCITGATPADYQTLAAWKAKSDANSVSKAVVFNNAATADLTLTGTSVGDAVIQAAKITGYDVDKFNTNRPSTTYMGANQPVIPTIGFASSTIDKTYGAAASTPQTASSNSAGVITYSSGTTSVATIDAGTGELTIVGVGSSLITATQAASGNYTSGSATYTVNVAAKTLTITNPVVTPKTYNGTNTAVITGTLSGIINSDDVTFSGTGTFASVNVADGIAVTSTSTLGGAKAGNYTLTQPTGLTGDITAATGSPTGDNLNNSGLTDNQLANTNLTISSGEFIINDTKTVRSLTVAPGARLTHSSGTLTATNGITLESDATGTATLMDSYTEPTISATVKQYLTAGRNWYMSAPLNNTADYSVLNKGASVAEYNETTGLWPAVTSGNLTRGKGYVQVASASQGTTGTVSFNGTTNSGDVPVTLTYTSDKGKGYNLVGNPYPSYLSWSAVAADNAAANMPTGTMWYRTINYNGKSAWTPTTAYSLNEIVYNSNRFYKVTTAGTSAASGGPSGSGTGITDNEVVWNYEGSVYMFATISASGVASPATVSNLVPPMQAFWVKSNGGTLTFKNTMRSHNTGGTNALKAPKNSASEMPLLRLSVTNGASTDEAVIYASGNASNTFDTYDAPKYFNTASNQPEIFTQVGNEKLVINAMNEIKAGTEIALGFVTEKGNDFTISALEFRNFGSEIQVVLKDKQLNKKFDLTTGQPYTFSSAVVNNTDRFSLIFRASGSTTNLKETEKLNAQIFVNANNQITIIAREKANYSIYNAMGQLVSNGLTTSNRTILSNKLINGIYVVSVSENGRNYSNRLILNGK
jgi:hypothetical protein